MTTEVVTEIPPQTRKARMDPWLDEVLDGQTHKVTPATWRKRYQNPDIIKARDTARSGLHQAATYRGKKVAVETRDLPEGLCLFVTASLNPNGQEAKPAKRVAKKAAVKAPAKKAPAKRAAAKKAPAKRAPAKASSRPAKKAATPREGARRARVKT